MENKDLKIYNPGHDFSNSKVETWIHKQCVVKTGDTEDDFIIVEKPVKIDEYDLDKRIQEEAKGTDLKSLIAQVLRTGDDSILNQKQGFYGDITGMPKESIEAHNLLIEAEKKRKVLGITKEDLERMSKEDLIQYIQNKNVQPDAQIKTEEAKTEEAKTEEAKTGKE